MEVNPLILKVIISGPGQEKWERAIGNKIEIEGGEGGEGGRNIGEEVERRKPTLVVVHEEVCARHACKWVAIITDSPTHFQNDCVLIIFPRTVGKAPWNSITSVQTHFGETQTHSKGVVQTDRGYQLVQTCVQTS